ncbi:acyl carrier protein [bacterium]|nr:acyl carrier protein [bacterium]MBU1072614.1 acyl carrier protein [bacterium]MBU1674477.1 acyl carrier protein [bacterium]
MELRDQIHGFVVENFLFGDLDPLRDDEMSLLDNGIMDSVGVMELVAFLEQDMGLSIDDSELVPENLDSIRNLVGFVTRKRG